MKRAYSMPFGAQLTEGGRTRFRLWAPAAKTVTVSLEARGSKRDHDLTTAGDGWFEAVVDGAPAGTRYAYSVDGGKALPDPASRCNPDDVHAASVVIDPNAFTWQDASWRGRPWHEAVIYELHVGTFTEEGTFAAAIERIGHLKSLGITAIELMPVADFAGSRNWGYDGVLMFAPDASYGTPDDLKRFIDAAHAARLMVLLDVVYNHFGPEGNYLPTIAPDFFNPAHHTPWGAAINYDGRNCRPVRDFVVHNALYWLTEYHFDGLRLDAVHAIVDTSSPHILTELTERVRSALPAERHVHLVFENDDNAARYLAPDAQGRAAHATAQWNDDVHHALHVLLTAETDGYYADYAKRPLLQLGRCLAEGYAYQGDWSPFRSNMRGEPSAGLPLGAFVNFLQNHDQIGNRAYGERIVQLGPEAAVRAAAACLLLSPSPPMLFMGEEFAASSPFLFFCDFSGELAQAVTRGRRNEFSKFGNFSDPRMRERIPDPNARDTFERSRLRWHECAEPEHARWLTFYRECLALRHDVLAPLLRDMHAAGRYDVGANGVLTVRWKLGGHTQWRLDANLSRQVVATPAPEGRVVFSCGADEANACDALPAWGVRFSMARTDAA